MGVFHSGNWRPVKFAVDRSAWWLVPVVYVISTAAFIMDVARDNTLAYGIFYTPLIATAVYHKRRFGLWLLTCAACVMVIIGAFAPVVDPDLPDMIGNRLLSVLAILATAAFVHHGRNVQERLSNETRRAEAAERIKTDLLTNLSQKIRTPLHSLVGMLALTIADSRPDQRQVLGRVGRDSRELLVTIDNLIDLSEIEMRELARDTINLAAIVQEARESATTAAQDRQIRIGFDAGISAEQSLAIGDRWATRRILDNLLVNAVRSTPSGSTVLLSVGRSVDRITARVHDTGNGRVEGWEQSFGDTASVDGARGVSASDIGLALSSHLARLMGGRLIVEHEPSHGTTVTLSLPAV